MLVLSKEKLSFTRSEEISTCIYFLNLITSTVLSATIFFSQIFDLLLSRPLFYFILSFTFHLCPPHVGQIVGVDPCHINTFLKSLGSSCKAEKYCSDITSSLMQSESKLQSIQCGGSSFPLDISQLSFVLYVHNIYSYQQNFLECHSI